MKFGAEVKLDGIVILSPKRIEFKIDETNVILRQTTIQDIEKEIPDFYLMYKGLETSPTHAHHTVLNIEFLGRQAYEIQKKVEQAITVLRLFKVGSVMYKEYHMYSESFTAFLASGILYGKKYLALERCVITEEDAEKIEKFWQKMIKAIPHSFYDVEARAPAL